MSLNASQIINIVTRISPQGLANANFGLTMLFSPESELPVGFSVNTFRTYTSMTDLAVDFDSATEVNKAAARFMQMTPTPQQIKVFGRSNVTDTDTIIETLDIAANLTWWFWTFFTEDVYDIEADVKLIADWADSNGRYVLNCSTAANIRDPIVTTDIASELTTTGQRHISTFSHATDPYAGHAIAAWFASVNYSIPGSTITGELKKLPSVAAEDLTGTEYAAMQQVTKKAVFYTVVDLQGSSDLGRVINSWSHSSFGEFIDDVVNLDAFVNALRVALFNAVANQVGKLPQTPAGQQLLITETQNICEQYIANGYLGPRTWTNPDTGQEEDVPGYVILTKAEDVLTLSDSDRADRKSAPMRVRVFRAGAVHAVDVTVDVF